MKILIIHTAFIGDVVLSTPLLKRIKEIYPEAKISYVTTPAGASVLRNNPRISEIIEYDKRGLHKGAKGLLQLGKRLRYDNFEIVITLHRYLRSSILSWLTRSPKRIGYENAVGASLFTNLVKYDTSKHEVEKLLSFVGKLPKKANENYKIELYPNHRDINNVDSIWREYSIGDEKKVVIAPGSKWYTKQWPIEYFNSLIKMLDRDGIRTIIIGGKDEQNLEIELGELSVDLRGKTTLLESAEILKRSDILVSNDSSPIHIASAWSKVRIIAIFGPTVKKLGFFPWSLNSEVMEDNSVECRPCSLHGGRKCPKKHFKCMKNIIPEKIYESIKKV